MNYKFLVITLLFLFFYGQNQSQNSTCNGTRYVNEEFTNVKETIGQLYGNNTTYNGVNKNLLMDIYEPDGDTATKRPVIVLAFPGAFIQGNRGDLYDICYFYAARGFVAVTIDYRLYDGPLFPIPSASIMTDAAIKAMGDMKAAIRFLKQDAATINLYKIDTNKVFVGGISSGAITANAVAYIDSADKEDSETNLALIANGGLKGNSSSNFQYSSSVFGVLSFSGAVLDTNVIDVNEPPIFMVHDDQDPTVAYGTGFASALGFPIITVEGSSIMAIRGTNVGLNNELITIPNSANHVSYLKAGASVWEDSIFNASTKFLNNIICPLQPQNISEKESKNTISLYPNPTTGFVNIDLDKVLIKTVQLSGVDGRIIFKDASINSSKYRFNIDGNSGLYVVEITTQNTKENFQILKK